MVAATRRCAGQYEETRKRGNEETARKVTKCARRCAKQKILGSVRARLLRLEIKSKSKQAGARPKSALREPPRGLEERSKSVFSTPFRVIHSRRTRQVSKRGDAKGLKRTGGVFSELECCRVASASRRGASIVTIIAVDCWIAGMPWDGLG